MLTKEDIFGMKNGEEIECFVCSLSYAQNEIRRNIKPVKGIIRRNARVIQFFPLGKRGLPIQKPISYEGSNYSYLNVSLDANEIKDFWDTRVLAVRRQIDLGIEYLTNLKDSISKNDNHENMN